jgi:hypothetical protein
MLIEVSEDLAQRLFLPPAKQESLAPPVVCRVPEHILEELAGEIRMLL